MALGFLTVAPGIATADTIMLMMESGAENTERMEVLSRELSAAGHKPMVTGAILEDSALMVGCDAAEGACIDAVIETGGSDGAVIVPQDAGELVVRRGGVVNSARVAAGASDYDWKVALSQAFGLPAPFRCPMRRSLQSMRTQRSMRTQGLTPIPHPAHRNARVVLAASTAPQQANAKSFVTAARRARALYFAGTECAPLLVVV